MNKIYLLIILLSVSFQGHGQIIITVAGNGTNGYSGDGGVATSAEMGIPWGVATDNHGNVYFSDNPNVESRIRKVNAAGIISTVAGIGTEGYSGDGGLAVDAQIVAWGVAVSPDGNIYFADGLNHRIRKIDTSGVIITIAGTGTAGDSGDGAPATLANINRPNYIAIDGLGNIFFTDQFSYVVRKINSLGIISTIAGNGTSGYSGDGHPATTAQLNNPVGIAVDVKGNIYISDGYSSVVRKVDTAGIINTIAGNGYSGFSGDGGPALSAELNEPDGLAVDGVGNLYICEMVGVRVRKVDTSGIITTVAGDSICLSADIGDGGPATSACLARPNDVKVDAEGNLFIADGVNYRIRKVTDTASSHPVVNANSFKVYPNPTDGQFTAIVRSNSETQVDITIANVVGQVVKKITSVTNKNIDISLDVLPGVYLLSAAIKGSKWCQKVLVAP